MFTLVCVSFIFLYDGANSEEMEQIKASERFSAGIILRWIRDRSWPPPEVVGGRSIDWEELAGFRMRRHVCAKRQNLNMCVGHEIKCTRLELKYLPRLQSLSCREQTVMAPVPAADGRHNVLVHTNAELHKDDACCVCAGELQWGGDVAVQIPAQTPGRASPDVPWPLFTLKYPQRWSKGGSLNDADSWIDRIQTSLTLQDETLRNCWRCKLRLAALGRKSHFCCVQQ